MTWPGRNTRTWPDWRPWNRARVMTIPLTQGQVALVSAENYGELSQFKWYAYYNPNTRSCYAQRGVRLPNGKWTIERMHRQILGLSYSDKRQGDHVNFDTLDNRRCNLRIATNAQNNANKRRIRNNTSGFKGLSRDKRKQKLGAQIGHNGKKHWLGYFTDKSEASFHYLMAAIFLVGEFDHAYRDII
jgi:hypothetical protein